MEQSFRRRDKHHLCVIDTRDTGSICNEITCSLVEFLRQRFSIDEGVISQLAAFVHFDTQNVNLRTVHKAIAIDLDITELSLEFDELSQERLTKERSLPDLVKCLVKSEHFSNVLTVLCRILAAKPHSADMERVKSANNLLKTSQRSSLDLKIESVYTSQSTIYRR